jgi:hypothetical protein
MSPSAAVAGRCRFATRSPAENFRATPTRTGLAPGCAAQTAPRMPAPPPSASSGLRARSTLRSLTVPVCSVPLLHNLPSVWRVCIQAPGTVACQITVLVHKSENMQRILRVWKRAHLFPDRVLLMKLHLCYTVTLSMYCIFNLK